MPNSLQVIQTLILMQTTTNPAVKIKQSILLWLFFPQIQQGFVFAGQLIFP